MSNGTRSSVHVYLHLVWATARRRALLPVARDAWLARRLAAHAAAQGCRVVACGNADDHAHVVLALGATSVLAGVVQAMKGTTAREWNAHPDAPTHLAWQDGYWAESIAPASVAAVARYARKQRERHCGGHAPEPWEHWFLDVAD